MIIIMTGTKRGFFLCRYMALTKEEKLTLWPKNIHLLGGYSYVPKENTQVFDYLLNKFRICDLSAPPKP